MLRERLATGKELVFLVSGILQPQRNNVHTLMPGKISLCEKGRIIGDDTYIRHNSTIWRGPLKHPPKWDHSTEMMN
jgi:hypothetical protein